MLSLMAQAQHFDGSCDEPQERFMWNMAMLAPMQEPEGAHSFDHVLLRLMHGACERCPYVAPPRPMGLHAC